MVFAAVAQNWSQEHLQSSSASRVAVEPHHGLLETLSGKEPLTLMTGQKIPPVTGGVVVGAVVEMRDIMYYKKMYKNEHVNS